MNTFASPKRATAPATIPPIAPGDKDWDDVATFTYQHNLIRVSTAVLDVETTGGTVKIVVVAMAIEVELEGVDIVMGGIVIEDISMLLILVRVMDDGT